MGNKEKIQQIYMAFEQGHLPAILEQLAESVEWEYGLISTDVPWLQARRGRTNVPGFFESMNEFELHKFEPKMFLESGNVVVVLIDVELTVKKTGIRVIEEDEIHLWHFDSEGKISRFAHKVDTHQHWAAYQGKSLQKSQMST
jgi:uncharacterized protein